MLLAQDNALDLDMNQKKLGFSITGTYHYDMKLNEIENLLACIAPSSGTYYLSSAYNYTTPSRSIIVMSKVRKSPSVMLRR